MKFRNTAILALIVAALGAYLYWVERPAMDQSNQIPGLLEVDPGRVTRIELHNSDQEMELERDGQGWRIIAPVEAIADTKAVEALIHSAARAEVKSTISAPQEDLGRFGLEPPQASLWLYVDGQALDPLSVGKSTPIGFNAYARRGDQGDILITAGTVRAALMRKLNDLRDTTIAEFSSEDIVALEIRSPPDAPVRLERAGPGWRITMPIAAPASAETVDRLLQALTGLRAVEFLDEASPSDPNYGLEPAALELLIETSDGNSRRLRIGNEVDRGEKKLVAANFGEEPQVYLVASHVPAGLGRSLDQLREKKVLWIDADAVAQISVTRADQEDFQLIRDSGDWKFGDETIGELDPELAEKFFLNLLALQGKSVLTEDGILQSDLQERPLFEIEFTDARDNSLATLVVANTADAQDDEFLVGTRAGGPTYTLGKNPKVRVDRRPGELLAIAEGGSVID